MRTYLRNRELALNYPGHIITTHQKLRHSSVEFLEKYEIIVDEDILKSTLTNATEIDISDLVETLEEIGSKKGFEELADKINMVIDIIAEKEYFTLPKIKKPKNVTGISIPFDIPAFCENERFCYDSFEKKLSFLRICPLHENLKYTVMSATADYDIFSLVYGRDRVKFYDCKRAKNKGKQIQYANMSMSRIDIDLGNQQIFNKIWDKHGRLPTITHKKYFTIVGEELHFGNTEGSNKYSNKNIIVAGTPHQNEMVIKRIAHTLGFDVSDKLKRQQIMRNGFIFWFYTYTDKVLQNLALWLIESDLEQAVGRARLLRKDCVIYIYSNYPLELSVFEESDFKDKDDDFSAEKC